MAKKKDRKPIVRDTVYLRGDPKSPAMYLDRIYIRNNREYGHCVWSTTKIVNDELVHATHDGDFLLKNLTIIPPPMPTQISVH